MTISSALLLPPGWTALAAVRPAFFATLLAAVLMLQGCAGGNTSAQALSSVDWRFARDAVTLDIFSTPDLNFASDEPHTLVLAVFQMRDAAVFRKLLTDPDALGGVLEGAPPADGFLRVTRYVVSPGKQSTISIDRAENARFVGIAAGYFEFDASKAARVFEVPVSITRKGWFTHHYDAAPGPLALRLELGALAITRAEIQDGTAVRSTDSPTAQSDNAKPTDKAPGLADTTPLKQL